MQISLNVWDAPSGTYSRIYINGLPADGKIYLQGSKGMTLVKFEGSPGNLTAELVLGIVSEAAGCDARNFEVLLRTARTMPPPKRGKRPGSTAAGGKGAGWNYFEHSAARPSEWTTADTYSLDPNRWKDPLPERTRLLVDHREPREMLDFFERVENLEVEVVSLQTGDFVIPDRLVIERKTAPDLVRSVVDEDKRVFYQTERMANSDLPGVLLLEGNIYEQTGMRLNAITGTLSFISAIQGTSIIPTISPLHSADMVVKLARHSIYGLGYDLALRGAWAQGAATCRRLRPVGYSWRVGGDVEKPSEALRIGGEGGAGDGHRTQGRRRRRAQAGGADLAHSERRTFSGRDRQDAHPFSPA